MLIDTNLYYLLKNNFFFGNKLNKMISLQYEYIDEINIMIFELLIIK